MLAIVLYAFEPHDVRWLRLPFLGMPWAAAVGMVVMFFSIVLKVAAYRALGMNWSATPKIRQDHSLVREGPYALVRHPVYASNIVLLAGVFLATGSVVFLGLGACYFVTDNIRANAEEQQLIARFGDAYIRYRSVVGKYFPRTVSFMRITMA